MASFTALAQDPSPANIDEFAGLDVVFLVEQSISMNGGQGHPEPNDAGNFRVYGPRMAIDILADDSRYFHPKAIHRVGFISFGSQARVDLPLSLIKAQSQGEWPGEEPQSLKTRLQPGRLGNADMMSAFETAAELFNMTAGDTAGDNEGVNAASGPRKRALLVIIDGDPTVKDAETQMESYLENLKNYAQQNFPSPEFEIWILAIADNQNSYWDNRGVYWQDLSAGRAKLLRKSSDLPEAIKDVLAELIPNPVVDNQAPVGLVRLPPYLKKVIFTFHPTHPEPQIAIYRPDGNIVKDEEADVERKVIDGQTYISIMSPLPGDWRVVSQGAMVEMERERAEFKLKLTSPETPLLQRSDLTLAYQILAQDAPLKEFKDYPLNVTASIRSPSGEEWVLPLLSYGNGNYRSRRAIQVHTPGEYHLSVSGYLLDKEGEKRQLFQAERNDIIVIPAESLKLIVEPLDIVSASVTPPLQLRVMNDNKAFLSLRDISRGNPDALFKIKIRDREGHEQPVIKPPGDWSTWPDRWLVDLSTLPKGAYYVQVKLVSEELQEGYMARPENAEQEILFVRQEERNEHTLWPQWVALGVAVLLGAGLLAMALIKSIHWLYSQSAFKQQKPSQRTQKQEISVSKPSQNSQEDV